MTGSAHCALCPYWTAQLLPGCDASAQQEQPPLLGYQASARGGVVKVALQQGDRVLLAGTCVTTIRAKVVV